MENLVERFEALEQRCERAERAVAELRKEKHTVLRQLRRARCQGVLSALALLAALLLTPGNRAAIAQGGNSLAERVAALESAVAALQTTVNTHTTQIGSLQTTVNTHTTQIGSLQSKTQYISVSGGEMFLTGTNLHIRNGRGQTNGNLNTDPFDANFPISNGLGNLIIGYNEPRPDTGTSDRGGSHYLIVGPGHHYAAIGGVVAGIRNASYRPYASVLGGLNNTARSYYATVSGGVGNTASGLGSTVGGGENNIASGQWATVSGGRQNNATADHATVSGGYQNTASGDRSTVSGGAGWSATGLFDWRGGVYFSQE